LNVKELKKVIYNFLATKSSRVFDTEAPEEVNYPYIVYNLYSSGSDIDQKKEIFRVEIDIYDNNALDSTDIDSLANDIDGDGAIVSATGLHRKHYYSAGVVQTDIYRDTRESITEGESNIKHVQLTYDAYTYLR